MHLHSVIGNFPSACCHPHFSIHILSSAIFHPHFSTRIFLSAIRHPPSAIRHPPSAAIWYALYRDPKKVKTYFKKAQCVSNRYKDSFKQKIFGAISTLRLEKLKKNQHPFSSTLLSLYKTCWGVFNINT